MCCLMTLLLQKPPMYLLKIRVWLTSLLCITVLPGLVEELHPIDFRNAQVFCAYLYQYFLVRMFMLISVQFVTRVVFVRRWWPPITRSFLADMFLLMNMRVFVRWVTLIGSVLRAYLATCHLWLPVVMVILKVKGQLVLVTLSPLITSYCQLMSLIAAYLVLY